MRGISTIQKAFKKPKARFTLKVKRAWRRMKDKIRNRTMDAFRNAKDIMMLGKNVAVLEKRIKDAIEDPRESKIDYALEAFRKSEAKNTKTINSKLLLLILLWILDKVVLFALFQWFNGVS